MIRCGHSALRGLCGIRGCHHYGKALPRDALPGGREDRKSPRPRPRSSAPHPGGEPVNPTFVDMTGKVVGGWTVVHRARNVQSGAMWVCRHECGVERVIPGGQLRAKPPRCACQKEQRSIGGRPRKSRAA
jgi:hypothetical protein